MTKVYNRYREAEGRVRRSDLLGSFISNRESGLLFAGHPSVVSTKKCTDCFPRAMCVHLAMRAQSQT